MTYSNKIALLCILLIVSSIPFINNSNIKMTSSPIKPHSTNIHHQQIKICTKANKLFNEELCKELNHQKVVEKRQQRRKLRTKVINKLSPARVEEMKQKIASRRSSRIQQNQQQTPPGQRRQPNTLMGVSTITVPQNFSPEQYKYIRKIINQTKLGRAFNYTSSFPCYPKHNNRPNSGKDLAGIIYIRIPKSSSSTLAGINLRIASRQNKDLCGTAWYHKSGNRFDISNRDKAKTLLWTFIRQPTKRSISAFFYFEVSRKDVSTSDEEFKRYLTSSHVNDYQLKFCHGDLLTPVQHNNDPHVLLNASINRVQSVLNDYDFIGVTERFDESLVAMQLLFNLDIEDILYISSNVGGGYDNKLRDHSTGKEKCFRMHPSYLSLPMKNYFKSDAWYAWNTADFMLYDAANLSLDFTIEQTIGRDVFEYHLKRYQKLKQIGNEKCADTILPPCSSNGTKQSKLSSRNCYIDDMGCGFDCLDTITASKYL